MVFKTKDCSNKILNYISKVFQSIKYKFFKGCNILYYQFSNIIFYDFFVVKIQIRKWMLGLNWGVIIFFYILFTKIQGFFVVRRFIFSQFSFILKILLWFLLFNLIFWMKEHFANNWCIEEWFLETRNNNLQNSY